MCKLQLRCQHYARYTQIEIISSVPARHDNQFLHLLPTARTPKPVSHARFPVEASENCCEIARGNGKSPDSFPPGEKNRESLHGIIDVESNQPHIYPTNTYLYCIIQFSESLRVGLLGRRRCQILIRRTQPSGA